MSREIIGERYFAFHGDNRELLATLPDDSIDSVVTDPPAGIAFMGADWDTYSAGGKSEAWDTYDNPYARGATPRYLGKKGNPRENFVKEMTQTFREVLRVMKPGAYGLVWAIPKTSHWMAWALEDAGFDVMDVATHLFFQGFAKSTNVAKNIDKMLGMKPTIIGKIAAPAGSFGRGITMGGGAQESPDLTVPTSEEAKKWAGFGTALSPSSEHWILIRKPTDLTYAKNVLTYGVGALNIDACRIGDSKPAVTPATKQGKNSISLEGAVDGSLRRPFVGTSHDPTSGRWPKNVVMTHTEACVHVSDQVYKGETTRIYACVPGCPVRFLDDMAGVKKKKDSVTLASTIFYCTKVSPKQRTEGLPEGLTSHHPTEKHVDLLRYWTRLVTPPKGTCLDPFGGSGTTGMAALREGFSIITAEQDADFFRLIEYRLAAEEGRKLQLPEATQLSLF